MNTLKMLLSMMIFGSIGLVVSYIPLPSVLLCGLRAFLGMMCMAVAMILRRSPVNKNGVRKNIGWLLLSGTALALNWIVLFEAYRYTSVAVATLCYYMAPVFVTLLSPLVLKERLTLPRFLCTATAVAGAVLISGATIADQGELKGVLLALGAAVLYCAVVLFNKKITRLPAQETTFFQLLVAAVITLPYALITQETAFTLSVSTLVPLLILGVVHTGVAYLLFFDAAGKLPAQSTALLSYLDPVTAIVLSWAVLGETMTELQIAGAVLILGAALIGELVAPKKRRR